MAATYVMSASSDFTGPFADVSPNAVSGIRAIAAWWNQTKWQGARRHRRYPVHDMRYDASVVARTWPSILSTRQADPASGLRHAGPDHADEAPAGDKVPMLMSTAMVGPRVAAERLALLDSARPTATSSPGCSISCNRRKAASSRSAPSARRTAAGFVDQVKGVQKFAETNPDRFEVLEVQWVDASPVSVANEVRTLVRQAARRAARRRHDGTGDRAPARRCASSTPTSPSSCRRTTA